jgi:hypothetical protein
MKRSHFTTPRTLADAEFPVGYPTYTHRTILEHASWQSLAVGAVLGAGLMLLIARFL